MTDALEIVLVRHASTDWSGRRYCGRSDPPLNEAGQAVGFSYRFNGGSTDLGRSAWFYNGATTIDIGLTGTEYTSRPPDPPRTRTTPRPRYRITRRPEIDIFYLGDRKHRAA